MELIALIESGGKLPLGRLLFLSTVSGVSNAAILAVINVAARNVAEHKSNFWLLITLLLLVGVFVISQRDLMTEATSRIERIVHKIRIRVITHLQAAELLELDQIGRGDIYACISQDLQMISQSSSNLMIATQSAVLVVFTMLYVGILSMTAFWLAVVFTCLGALIHLSRSAAVQRKLKAAHELEARLVDTVNEVLDGFKEVKMSTTRSAALAEHLVRISGHETDLKIDTNSLYARDFVLSQVTFFFLTGMMVFVLPSISVAYVDVVVMTTTAILFMIGPVSNVVGGVPIFAHANSAAGNILRLIERLSEHEERPAPDLPPMTSFEEIQLDELTFRHRDIDGEEGFSVGPIDISIRKGEMIFVTGENGSGKSTLLRMLTGLYPARRGALTVDGKRVDQRNLAAYRNLFSVIFSDYHLFREFYGLQGFDAARASELLKLLEISRKVQVTEHGFDTIDLSGGQRKRLALVAALLEKKPICVFDEWAADQDPHFREKFYRVILPLLRKDGVTVIAVTHDDKYFDTADRRYHMRDGKLVAIPPQGEVLLPK